MRIKSYSEALRDALDQEMARDPRVIIMGEDVRPGVMGVTQGLYDTYGPTRVIDTPISETAFIGAAIGAAMTGLRPVVELMFCDFAGVCFDQILNQAAKLRYMTGGQISLPLVIRTTMGAGERAAAQHSQSLHHLFTAIPGLKIVVPATAEDAAGLLLTAIRDPDPVIFFENKMLYDSQMSVSDPAIALPFGKAHLLREGDDLTIVALSRMVGFARTACDELAQKGISADLIDPRTTQPLDEAAILGSLHKTGHLLVVDEGSARCGMAADIASLAASKGFHSLKAPVQMLTPPQTPIPFAPELEDAWLPSSGDIEKAAYTLLQKV
ncbi:pyruvate dehydrogenase subunit beta [Iodidimonas muriae]|uniref:Pyruvate dehydrogenase subunit beta n=1 Tax=Iodidimonas muriae TaxID=261467 RepID=A0ABQ2LFE0_9PROT|nr:alpha-ketoacid dehydrogenase subunit beta [Iodidimonas muriae]GER07610.1 pyruvate dehydrogenase subunit beta [Kordiimonadales bacterium JCM 17843]GGO13744.1 pyruvate dehydrogenase subunit beta [Iodidimonas muriae]